jgi:ubiquinone/menaquinone biosynthesis C-methylase UbiE
MEKSTLDNNLASAYDDFYKDKNSNWRMISAKYKVKNILKVCENKKYHKVLEVGAGDGSILQYLSESEFASEYYAVEISSSGVECILARDIKGLVQAQTFDGYKLPFDDNSFDLIILSHVLEHVEHERLLLRELRRVATNFVIEVPLDYRFGVDKRLGHFLAYGHINMYEPTSLRYLLLTEGFVINNDVTSLIAPEATFYNVFINQQKPSKLITKLRIHSEYTVKNVLGKFFGQKANERFANAYTVLCSKAKDKPKLL